MKWSVAVLLLVVFGCRAEEEIATEENVLVLTTDNFDLAVNRHMFLLVEFYAPWCGHCKALAPEYAKAATSLQESNSEIKLAKVDATENKELAEKYQVRGYPTIKFFREGKVQEFTGGRDSGSIVAWLEKKTGPAAKTISTAAELETFKDAKKAVVLGFFENVESAEAKVFLEVAATFDDVEFGITTSEEVKKAAEVTGNGVVILKPFDDGKTVYNLAVESVEAIKEWVSVYKLPLINVFTHESASQIFGNNVVKNHHILFATKAETENLMDAFKTAAEKFRGKVLFVTIQTDDEENAQVIDFFALKDSKKPVVRIVHLGNDVVKYAPESAEVTVETLIEFTQGFVDGKIEALYASEEVPENWNSEPVKVLVGKNFDEVTSDPTKAVFVEFYAPWCGHCKKLAPIWDELGAKFADNDEIIIAKMDATKNEVKNLSIKGFPTIKFYPAGADSVPLDYVGERTLDALVSFVNGKISGDAAAAETETETEAPHSEL